MAKRARTRSELRPSPADIPPLPPATSQGPAWGEATLTWRNRVAALGVERRAREIAFLDRAISDRNQQFRRLKEGVAELEQTLQDRISLSKDVPGLRAQRAELRRDLETLRRQRQDLAAAPAELIQAKVELDRVRHDLVLTRHEFAELERIRGEHESEVIELRERAATHQSAVGSALEELEKLNRHIERARRASLREDGARVGDACSAPRSHTCMQSSSSCARSVRRWPPSTRASIVTCRLSLGTLRSWTLTRLR